MLPTYKCPKKVFRRDTPQLALDKVITQTTNSNRNHNERSSVHHSDRDHKVSEERYEQHALKS